MEKRERDDITIRLFNERGKVIFEKPVVAYRRTFTDRGTTVWSTKTRRRPLVIEFEPTRNTVVAYGTIIPNKLLQSTVAMFGPPIMRWGRIPQVHNVQIDKGNKLTLIFGGPHGREPLFTLS